MLCCRKKVVLLIVNYILSVELLKFLFHHESFIGYLRTMKKGKEQIPNLLDGKHPWKQEIILDMTFVLEHTLLLEPRWLFLDLFELHLVFDNESSNVKFAALPYLRPIRLNRHVDSADSVLQLQKLVM